TPEPRSVKKEASKSPRPSQSAAAPTAAAATAAAATAADQKVPDADDRSLRDEVSNVIVFIALR
uniref:Uncharacterized protein n=1 Tax=Plectus sambesii TaxID=2011161 RepID=A0A914W160_9BILA